MANLIVRPAVFSVIVTPNTWSAHHGWNMIKENLVAERIAIDSYRDMLQYLRGWIPQLAAC